MMFMMPAAQLQISIIKQLVRHNYDASPFEICLFVCLLINSFIRLFFVYLFLCLFIYLFICLFIYSPLHLLVYFYSFAKFSVKYARVQRIHAVFPKTNKATVLC